MIGTYEDYMSFKPMTGRRIRPAKAIPGQPSALTADRRLPLLAAIAAELRLVDKVDELASLRAARRLLEEAFCAVKHNHQ